MVFSVFREKILGSGTCSPESFDQVMATAKGIAAQFPSAWFRAGVWKPRTRPGSFEGIGEPALEWLQEVRKETGLRILTEAATAQQAEACLKAGLDAVWIGARTTVNPFLVQEVADVLKGSALAVMVKNPLHPDAELWRGAIERLSNAVSGEVMAIHRGFHSFETSQYRNPPRWQVAFELRSMMPQLRMICDISHIAGTRPLLQSVAQEALDLHYDGWMVETHIHPDAALTDKLQQITPQQLSSLFAALEPRFSTTDDPLSLELLRQWRQEIDQLDDQLLQILHRRLMLSEKLGALKRDQQVSIFQPERWKFILEEMHRKGTALGIHPDFIRNLFIQIHDESIRIQGEVINNPGTKVS